MQNIRIRNPLQINDWPIIGFLKVILGIQLAVWLIIGLDVLDWQIPGLRQIICFIYIIYIPGVIILRVLRLHKLGNIETLLYSVGLSVAAVMFTGLFMNAVYPLFWISRPISVTPLMTTLSALILILCIISFIRDKSFDDPEYIEIKKSLSPSTLFLCLLPFCSIFGTYLVNFYNSNILLLLLLGVIALVVFLVSIGRCIPRELNVWTIFAIALSLVFYRSLISMYITGFDVHDEYYVASRVINTGVWDFSLRMNYNSTLSIAMLGPIASLICAIDLTWIYKIVYPLLLALALAGLYRVYQKQVDDRIAFLGCFFFMATSYFYTAFPTVPRQIVGFYFLVLLIMLITERNIGVVKAALLFVVISFSLAVSHYAVSFVYMVVLFTAWLILTLGQRLPLPKSIKNLYCRFSRDHEHSPDERQTSSIMGYAIVGFISVLLFAVFNFTWYIFASSSVVFDALVEYAHHIFNSITLNVLVVAPEQAWSAMIEQFQASILRGILFRVEDIIRRMVQILIIVGFMIALFRPAGLKLAKEYIALSVVPFLIYLVCIPVPFSLPLLLAPRSDLNRFIYIVLIVLALYFAIAGKALFQLLIRVVRLLRFEMKFQLSSAILSLFVVLYFLLQSGFIWETTNLFPSLSYSIGQESTKKYGRPVDITALYSAVTPEQDVLSARWLSQNMKTGAPIYAMYSDIRIHTLSSYAMIPRNSVVPITTKTKTVEKNAYVYLQYVNVFEGIATDFDISQYAGQELILNPMDELSSVTQNKNKIYSNGGSEIYK